MKFANPINSLIKRYSRNKDGVASVEFAIILPVLAFGMLGMVDIAIAIDGRMQMDSALRAAAESALSDPGEEVVENVFAGAKETVTNELGSDKKIKVDYDINVTRYCACPGSTSTVHACDATCSGSQIPYLYYEMAGTGSYSGILIPNITIARSIKVQLR